MFNINTE